MFSEYQLNDDNAQNVALMQTTCGFVTDVQEDSANSVTSVR
ncbi:hypothetical protein D515_03517 [Grimontia indica]|uniref:Uncharacterized protein n=1 Tax=Grimontia indica TaxID=1056512 RepID=R1IQY1_9GAMM|nr:hypothetical protein D515_03517 [Grimontia indica]